MNKDVLIAGSLALGCVGLICAAFILPKNQQPEKTVIERKQNVSVDWNERLLISNNKYDLVEITNENGKKYLLLFSQKGVSMIEYNEK